MISSNYNIQFEKILKCNYFSKSLHPHRKEAFAILQKTGFPTKNWEDWRFTDISPISKGNFYISDIQHSSQQKLNIDDISLEDVNTIIIYNGHFQKHLSKIPKNINLLSIEDYIKRKNGYFEKADSSPFDLFNTAFTDLGLCIVVEDNNYIEVPLRILFVSDSNRSLMINPRIYIDVNNSSNLTIIEEHIGNTSNTFFLNESIFISMEEKAHLSHIRIQSNSEFTSNVTNINVNQKSNSKYNFFQFTNGSMISRNNINIHLNEIKSKCNINCLTLSKNKQHIDNNIKVNHNCNNTNSSQYSRSILLDSSSGVFNGRTIVKENAQKIIAKQTNNNLLLSKHARMNSNPQLEIYADDVKCTHGSTIGQIDEEALFYLQSRGINKSDAVKLIVKSFALDVLNNIHDNKINIYIKNILLNKMKNIL